MYLLIMKITGIDIHGTQPHPIRRFHGVSEVRQASASFFFFFFLCLLFTFLLSGIVMAKSTAGPKKEFSKIQQIKSLDFGLPKVHFPP